MKEVFIVMKEGCVFSSFVHLSDAEDYARHVGGQVVFSSLHQAPHPTVPIKYTAGEGVDFDED